MTGRVVDAIRGYAEHLAWLATHGVDIYQFLGEQHRDDAERFADGKPRKADNPRRPSKPRRKRGPRVIRYKGPGFSKAL